MRKLRIVTAFVVAIGSCILSPRKSWSRISGTSALLWNVARGKMHWADPFTAAARYKKCEACPIFYKPLHTCGSPFDREMKGTGCFCSMDYKKNIREATCWGDDNLGEDFKFGWHSLPKVAGSNHGK